MMRVSAFLILMAFGAGAAEVSAAPATNDAPAALASARLALLADIERDTEALNRLRADIATRRRPLAEQMDALRTEVAARRADIAGLRRLDEGRERDRVELDSDIARLREDCRFLHAVFEEYVRAMETRLDTAEAERLAGPLRAVELALGDGETFGTLPEGVDRLLDLAETGCAGRMGGYTFEGTAMDSAGVEHGGRYAVFGPLSFFAAAAGAPAGLAVTELGSPRPAVFTALPEGAAEAIARLVGGEEASVPVDVTSGDALKVARARTTLVGHVKKGGFVMIPLLAVGAIALALILWKTADLLWLRVRPGGRVDATVAAIRSGDIDGAMKLARSAREPLATLLTEAIEHRDSPRDHLEEIIHEHLLGSLPRLERHLGALAVLGGVAPLLGLLGTVTGMIHTFQLVTVFGSGDAKLLSGGISEALITTEFGLGIAIPILLAHAFLTRRVRDIIGALERMAASIVNDLKVRRAGA